MWVRRHLQKSGGVGDTWPASIPITVPRYSYPIQTTGASLVSFTLGGTVGVWSSATLQVSNLDSPNASEDVLTPPNFVDSTAALHGVVLAGSWAGFDSGGPHLVAYGYTSTGLVLPKISVRWMRLKLVASTAVSSATCITKAFFDSKPEFSGDRGWWYTLKKTALDPIGTWTYESNKEQG